MYYLEKLIYQFFIRILPFVFNKVKTDILNKIRLTRKLITYYILLLSILQITL